MAEDSNTPSVEAMPTRASDPRVYHANSSTPPRAIRLPGGMPPWPDVSADSVISADSGL